MFGISNRLIIAVSLVLIVVAVTSVIAFRQSANFKLLSEVLDAGGTAEAKSASFILQGSLGQGQPIGLAKSANLELYAGFQVADSPSIAIRTDKLVYRKGDSMKVLLDLTNPKDTPIPAIVHLFFVSKSGIFLIFNFDFELPPNYKLRDVEIKITDSMPELEPGTYAFLALLSDKRTGLLDYSMAFWGFGGAPAEAAKEELTKLAEEYVENLSLDEVKNMQAVSLDALVVQASPKRAQASPREKPQTSRLMQNVPNPSNPDTWIPYQLNKDADVTIRIYNVTGQLVKTLQLGHKEAGFYLSKDRAAYWDGRNARGERVASGVYFYQIQAGDFTATGKMLLLK